MCRRTPEGPARGFENVRALAFDLDGTLWLGEAAIDGATSTLAGLAEADMEILYVTNGSGRSRRRVASKLRRFGFAVSLEQVYTSASATACWLADQGLGTVAMLGSEGLLEEITDAGLAAADASRGRNGNGDRGGFSSVGAVVVGLHKGYDWSRRDPLPDGLARAVRRGEALLVGCNRDADFPVEGGKRLPGCGALLALVERQCGRTADAVIGKPEVHLLERIASDCDLEPEAVAVVGDSVASDIGMALAWGCPSIHIAVAGSDEETPSSGSNAPVVCADSITQVPQILGVQA